MFCNILLFSEICTLILAFIYLSEHLSLALASLLSDERDLTRFLRTPVNFNQTGQQTHQQQKRQQRQQGNDRHVKLWQLISCCGKKRIMGIRERCDFRNYPPFYTHVPREGRRQLCGSLKYPSL